MPRSLLPVAVSLGVAVLVAGCGGKTPYSLKKTAACLGGQEGVRIVAVPASDFVATTALGGAVAARVGGNQVTITFSRDTEGAERIAQAYRRFRGRNIGIEDVLRPDRNAVLLWKAHPSEAEIAAVNGCLH